MRIPAVLSLAAAAALVVGACSASPAASPAPGASGSPPAGSPPPGQDGDGQRLAGRVFLSTAIDGRVLVAGSRVRLSFDDGRLGAHAGCNSMGGSFLIANGMLVATELATTEMACDAPLMEQDRWLAELLGGAGITLAGDTLTLERAGVRLTLMDREVADPDRPLEGTRWVVDGIVIGDAVSSVPEGVTAAISIAGARVTVEAGCNTGGGAVGVTDTTLSFGPIGLTKIACAPDVMAVEQAVVAALRGEVAYAIEADVLTLDAGAAALILRAAP